MSRVQDGMAPTAADAPLSDTETAERPVREQLKKASIGGMPGEATAALAAPVTSAPADTESSNGQSPDTRGRLERKRSFEEVDGESADQAPSRDRGQSSGKQHRRKRSRDSKEEDEEEILHNGKRQSGERAREFESTGQVAESANGTALKKEGTPESTGERDKEEVVQALTSPKTKRSRIHASTTEAPENDTLTSKPASSEAVDTTKPAEAKLQPSSGFSNTSASSPFASLASTTSPSKGEQQPQTSSSAFASSAFGSLASSSTSGFGAIGKSSGGFGSAGGFGTGGKSPLGAVDEDAKEVHKPAQSSSEGSAFGGTLGQKSAFSAAPSSGGASGSFGSASTSGFGKLGASSSSRSTFGGSLGSSAFGGLSPVPGAGGGLASFASGKPTSLSTTPKPAKPFGAPPDPEDEQAGEEGPGVGEEGTDDATGSGVKSPAAIAQEDDEQDDRFYAQQVETGEEEEETAYSCRAKLYEFATLEDGKKEWRERGLGVLRFNVHYPKKAGKDEPKVKARFLMRADGSHRVKLNTPVKKEISYGAANGGPPQSGLMLFMGTIDGKTTPGLLQLKVRCALAGTCSV